MTFVRDLLVVLALALAWVGPLSPAVAAEPLARVRAQVAQVPLLRGEFSQEKQVAGFRNPLRSSGRFLLARDKGVVWTTLAPFPSETVITQDRILSRQRDGSRRVEVDGRQQPGLRSINAMMFALMSGDTRALTAAFDVKEETGDGKGWRMEAIAEAKPAAASVRAALKPFSVTAKIAEVEQRDWVAESQRDPNCKQACSRFHEGPPCMST